MRILNAISTQIHISIDPELKRIALHTAANTGGSVSDLITLALQEYLATRNPAKKSRHRKTGTCNKGI